MLATAEQFEPYGTAHLVAVLVLVGGAVGLAVAGRRVRDDRDRLGKVLAIAILVTTIPLQVLYFTPAYWDLQTTIPIQLCDVASVVAAYALWTRRWWAVALTYFWGLTLTPQAIATPTLEQPVGHPVFWLFWGMHIGTIWAAAYLTWGRRVTPDWRGYRLAVAVTAVWALAVFGFNLLAGTNYGFLNRKPGSATILDLLGPWPWYVAAEIAILLAAWALATWPWVRARSRAPADPVDSARR
ncbi:TIGR02206 family membrane protein [Nocardioides coralli]|uniref:YwaF family protein n=1 Tax=Nocardioides coralli TaxID=2872154 RepID=UPI001CA39F66|nr:TIGR02206 family membrane protein [Nocardioides coralli]QZY29727.1 TIGR02206 family membrane protein [Nocardioides coralli]